MLVLGPLLGLELEQGPLLGLQLELEQGPELILRKGNNPNYLLSPPDLISVMHFILVSAGKTSKDCNSLEMLLPHHTNTCCPSLFTCQFYN